MPENQLTETLALVLQLHPRLASDLVSRWTEVAVGPLRRVDTEVSVDRQSVDLELVAEDANGQEIVAWIEVKRGMSHESGPGQVRGYRDRLDRRCEGLDRRGWVVYLTRAGVESAEGTDVHDNWTSLGEWLEARYAARLPLVADFVKYLKEESLLMSPLSLNDVEVLAHQGGAQERVAQLLDLAGSEIRKAAGDLGLEVSSRQPRSFLRWGECWGRVDLYENYSLAEASHQGPLLIEWNLRRRDSAAGSEGKGVTFAAGLTWVDTEATPWLGMEAERNVLLGAEPPFTDYADNYSRLYRWLGPSELGKAGPALEDQAERLSEFVATAFRDAIDAYRSACVPPRLDDE